MYVPWLFLFCRDKSSQSRQLENGKDLIWGLHLKRVRIRDHHGIRHTGMVLSNVREITHKSTVRRKQMSEVVIGKGRTFETSNPIGSDIPPPTRPHCLIHAK